MIVGVRVTVGVKVCVGVKVTVGVRVAVGVFVGVGTPTILSPLKRLHVGSLNCTEIPNWFMVKFNGA